MKNKKSRENRKSERDGGGHQRNKIDLIVEENSSFEISDYYHTIYYCQ